MHCTDKHSQHGSIIWPVLLNGWVFAYKLSGCGFESRCCHFTISGFHDIDNDTFLFKITDYFYSNDI